MKMERRRRAEVEANGRENFQENTGLNGGLRLGAARPEAARGRVGKLTRGHGSKDLAQRGTGDRMIGWGIKFRVTGVSHGESTTQVSASRPSAAGAWSRLPKAEWLMPEGLMPWWPSPVTCLGLSQGR